MKKNIIIQAVLFVLVTAMFIGMLAGVGDCRVIKNITRTVPAVVEEINPATGWATLVDWSGEAWHCEDDSLEVGQLVIVEFDDMGTEDIYDDEIVSVRVD